MWCVDAKTCWAMKWRWINAWNSRNADLPPRFSSFRCPKSALQVRVLKLFLEIHIWMVVTGTMECYDFPFSWEFHNSKWRTPSFVGGVANNHQPDTILYHIYIISYYTMLYQCLVNWVNLVSIHPFLPVPTFFLLARDAADVVRPEASILWSTPWEWPWFRSRGRRTGPGLLPQLPS